MQGKEFSYKTAKVEQDTRADISAKEFWKREQKSFLDIHILNSLASGIIRLCLEILLAMNERDKIRMYVERIIDIEQGTFTLILFTSAEGMARQSHICKRMTELKTGKGGRGG